METNSILDNKQINYHKKLTASFRNILTDFDKQLENCKQKNLMNICEKINK